jgi:SHS2 domain-containing protein
MIPYRMLDIATADMAFEAFGKNLDDLFTNCGLAVTAVMTDPPSVKRKEAREFTVGGHDLPSLLFDYLTKILYFKDAEGIVFSGFSVRVRKKDGGFSLSCTARGEALDRRKHELRTEVKAATYHQMKVEEKAGRWRAQVVLDT